MDTERDREGDGILKFSADIVGKERDVKYSKNFAREKRRQQQLKVKFVALRNLIPNPTKADQASVIGDAIAYINELKRNLEEFTILVERKRCNSKKKSEDDSTLDVESINTEKEVTSHKKFKGVIY